MRYVVTVLLLLGAAASVQGQECSTPWSISILQEQSEMLRTQAPRDENLFNEINRRLEEARSRPECGVEFWLEKQNLNLATRQPRADEEWFPQDPTTMDFLDMDVWEQVAYLDGLRVGAEWWRSSTPCWGAPNPNGGSLTERDAFTPREIVWGLLHDLSMVDKDQEEEWLAGDARVRIYETCQKGHPEDRGRMR